MDAPQHSQPAPEPMWRQVQCDCGSPYIVARTPRGKTVLVTAEPQDDGNLELTRSWGSAVPTAVTLAAAKRFGRRALRTRHSCRFADARLRQAEGR